MRNMFTLERKVGFSRLRFAFFVSLCFSASTAVVVGTVARLAFENAMLGMVAAGGTLLATMFLSRYVVSGMSETQPEI